MTKPRILSGMRPTGPLHLGNYVGALRNWVQFQESYQCFYMIADWHALMSEYKASADIAPNTREVVADWIAAGLDPARSVLFRQSDVPQHCELHVILSTVTPVGWLERCPTYKEQLQELKEKEIHTYAFLGYPVLQAADILLYKADAVPVGEDQLPHLEITREIARRFNNLVGRVFPEPQAILTTNEQGQRLLGLDRRKMSKSYGNAIMLGEGPDEVRRKVSTMITDPQRARRTDPGRPDYCNVCAYFRVFAPDLADDVADKCRTAQWGCVECKRLMGDKLVDYLAEFRGRRQAALADPRTIDDILADGARQAREQAAETLQAVRQALGF